jgi:hypothetical protein
MLNVATSLLKTREYEIPTMRAGAQLIIMVICHTDRNKKNSKSSVKKKRVTWDMRLVGSGSWFRNMLMTVNVNPERKVNTLARTLDRFKRYV